MNVFQSEIHVLENIRVINLIARSNKSGSKAFKAVEMSKPQRLQFTIPSDVDAQIHQAGTVLDSLVDDLEMTCFIFDGFGKNFIKSQKISPDSFIQMAIQLAFYRS